MEKLISLKERLKAYKKVAIAYSGGCDSNFLLQVSINTLGKSNVLAVLCIGDMMSNDDINSARNLLSGVNYKEVKVDVLGIDEFKNNKKSRCYYCKRAIMNNVISEAEKLGFNYILDGKNLDDEVVYRPGIEACRELGILSPIAECGMTKEDVRRFSKELKIETFNKPSNSCLASRFNYNTLLTKEKLENVDKAEVIFNKLGINYVRVRVQGNIARIEVEKKFFYKVLSNQWIVYELKKLGFKYITLDLEGISSGKYDS